MAFTQSTPAPFAPGAALQGGDKLNSSLANPQYSATYNQSVLAAQNSQALGVPVTSTVSQFSSVGAGGAVVLQCGGKASAPQFQDIYNNGGQALLVFPPVGWQIDGGAVNASVTLSNGNRCRYTAVSPGVILSSLLGAVSA